MVSDTRPSLTVGLAVPPPVRSSNTRPVKRRAGPLPPDQDGWPSMPGTSRQAHQGQTPPAEKATEQGQPVDSMMNCEAMCLRVAPSERRRPISPLRSMTEMTMMLTMPMPPLDLGVDRTGIVRGLEELGSDVQPDNYRPIQIGVQGLKLIQDTNDREVRAGDVDRWMPGQVTNAEPLGGKRAENHSGDFDRGWIVKTAELD